jgi:ABC-2 type transport system permease protein
LLGVYLTISALRGWFIGPSLEVLAGIEGDVWSGRFDFTLLRPINTQFFVSVRQWNWFALIDLALGLGAIVVATIASATDQPGSAQPLSFLVAATASVAVLYAILLIFTALVFWSPGLLFTWVFDAIMQLARYPIGIYPGWLQFVLTWIIPVAIMTTIPATALTGDIQPMSLMGGVALAVILFIAASVLFRLGVRRYNSASS